MNAEAQKTKPVWRVERRDQEDGSITYEIWDHNPENYRRVVQMNDGSAEEGKNARKDATTIAHAVNNYDHMLAALKAIRSQRPDYASNVWDDVDEAISKAEGRS